MLSFLDSGFDPSQEILLACINSYENENNVDKLRSELKKVTAEVNTKRRELNIISLNEEGLRNNIQYLKDIIKIKVVKNLVLNYRLLKE